MTVDLSAAFGESANARLRGLLPRTRSDATDRDSPAEPPAGTTPAHDDPSSGTAAANDDDHDDDHRDDADDRYGDDADEADDWYEDEDEDAPDQGTGQVRDGDDDERAGRPAAGLDHAAPRPRRRPAPASPAPRRRAEASTGARRWGLTRVASPEHVDLLVLAALAPGPDSAAGIIASLREGSDGLLDAPDRTVHVTLHRLTRNHLLRRVGTGPRGGPRYALTTAGARAVEARTRRWKAFARAVDGVLTYNDLD